MRPSSSVSPEATRSSPRKSSTVTPRAGSPRSVSRTWVEMLTSRASYSWPVDERERFLIRYAGVIRPGADRARRGRVGRDRLRQADPRLHLGPDLLHPRPQPPAHRGGGSLGARRGRPPELLDALRARARARRAAGRPLPGPARPRAAPQHRHGGERGRAEDGEDAHRPVRGRRPDAQLPRAALRHRVRELLDGARGLRARCCRGRSRYRRRTPTAARSATATGPATARASRSGFELVDQQSVGSLCALVVEPVLSAGGIIVPPDGYFRRVRELLDERGMLLLMDEAQTGFGRLGTMFGVRARRRRPRPRRRLEDARRRPAARGDDHVERDRAGLLRQGLPPRHLARLRSAARRGRACRARRDRGGGPGRALARPAASTCWPACASSRRSTSRSATCAAAGSWSGSSWSRTARPGRPPTRSARAVTRECYERGLSMNIVRSQAHANCFRIAPPLTVTEEEIDLAVEIIDASLRAVREPAAA